MKEIDTELAFKQIKKQNGEAVAKVLRSEILLDVPNIVHILEFAGNNPEYIKALAPVIREVYKTRNVQEYQTTKNPLELLSEAGYDAFVVTNEKQKNSIKKYYRLNEELCTFRDPIRHENYYMIHAVKRGADKIKPSRNPEREDEYGTSVISIQIAKTGGFISIKNRYNHTVNNPDATFYNNPDNIINGLSSSLKKFFKVDFNATENPLPDNYRMVNDQFVYFNYEIENIYFGPDYYFSGSTVTKLNTDYEVMLDYCILNTKTGELKNVIGLDDPTHKILQDLFKDKKISIRTNPNNKHERMIYADNTHMLSVEKGTITELNLPDTKRIGNDFLMLNENMKIFNAPKLEQVGHQFLTRNKHLIKINTPCLERTGCCFLHDNIELTELELPSLKEIADHCLVHNTTLSKLYVPKLEKIGPIFLMENLSLPELDLPLVKEVGDGCLRDNKILKRFYAPKLEIIGDTVFYDNLALIELNLPSLREVGSDFLSHNKKLRTFYAPKLQKIKWGFLIKNTGLTDIVVANDDIIHKKHNKRLVMVLAKNKIKKKVKGGISSMINMVVHSDNNKS